MGTRGTVAAAWFATGLVATLFSGRTTFLLGVAVGLGALLALQRARWTLACALAALTTLTSPVAGLFVALAAVAWALTPACAALTRRRARRVRRRAAGARRPPGSRSRRRRGAAIAVAALAPGASSRSCSPKAAAEPFVASAFWPALAAIALVAVAPPRSRAHAAHRRRDLRARVRRGVRRADGARRQRDPPRRARRRAGPRRGVLAAGGRDRRTAPCSRSCWRSPTGSCIPRSATSCARAATRRRRPPTTRRSCASSRAGPAPSASRSRSPRTTGRPHTSRRTWRSPAAGSASSTAATAHSSTTGRSRRRATARGWTSRRWRTSRCRTSPLDYSARGEARLVARGLPYLRAASGARAHWRVYAVRRGRPRSCRAPRPRSRCVRRLHHRARRDAATPSCACATRAGGRSRAATPAWARPDGMTRVRVLRPGPCACRPAARRLGLPALRASEPLASRRPSDQPLRLRCTRRRRASQTVVGGIDSSTRRHGAPRRTEAFPGLVARRQDLTTARSHATRRRARRCSPPSAPGNRVGVAELNSHRGPQSDARASGPAARRVLAHRVSMLGPRGPCADTLPNLVEAIHPARRRRSSTPRASGGGAEHKRCMTRPRVAVVALRRTSPAARTFVAPVPRVGWLAPMPARLSTLQARLLPHGPLDVVRQVLLFMAAYQLYRLTRGLVNHPEAATVAFRTHATSSASNARSTSSSNRRCRRSHRPAVAARRDVVDAHQRPTSVTVGALAWLYLFRNPSFYFVRNMFLVAFGVALIATAFPDGAAALLPRVRLLRRGLGLHGRPDRTASRSTASSEPVRRRAVHARRVRAHDRHPAVAAREVARAEGLLGDVPAAGRVTSSSRPRTTSSPTPCSAPSRRHRRAGRPRARSHAATRMDVPACERPGVQRHRQDLDSLAAALAVASPDVTHHSPARSLRHRGRWLFGYFK